MRTGGIVPGREKAVAESAGRGGMKFQTPLTVLGGGPGMHSSPRLGRARGSEECSSVVKEVLCVFTPGLQVINDSN